MARPRTSPHGAEARAAAGAYHDLAPLWLKWTAGPLAPMSGLLLWERMARAQIDLQRQVSDALRAAVRQQQDAALAMIDTLVLDASAHGFRTMPEAFWAVTGALSREWRDIAAQGVASPAGRGGGVRANRRDAARA